MPHPLPSAAYHALAQARGYTWLGPEVANIKTKTGWRCGQGHEWQARYANLQRGQGCPYCAYTAVRHPPAAYEALAQTRGYEWLGPEVRNINTKTTWRCGHGHQWPATYSEIKQGGACRHCHYQRRRHDPADYETLAARRGYTWLGPHVPNVDTHTTWRCGQGHQWPATYTAIRIGRGCPHCSGKAPKTPTDYETIAAGRGYEWLGPAVRNVMIKTGWRCSSGHEWQAPYRYLQQGHGCPRCNRRGRGRRRAAK